MFNEAAITAAAAGGEVAMGAAAEAVVVTVAVLSILMVPVFSAFKEARGGGEGLGGGRTSFMPGEAGVGEKGGVGEGEEEAEEEEEGTTGGAREESAEAEKTTGGARGVAGEGGAGRLDKASRARGVGEGRVASEENAGNGEVVGTTGDEE